MKKPLNNYVWDNDKRIKTAIVKDAISRQAAIDALENTKEVAK